MTGHKYDVSKAKRLESPIRRLFLPSNKVLNDINPKTSEVWADIGCGTGYFTIPLASLARKVYALDISKEMLATLKQHLISLSISNVDLMLSQESILPLEDNSVDGVFLAFVAHEVDKPNDFFSEVKRILKHGGRLTIVEFAKVLSFGPPLNHRLSPSQMDTWASNVGLIKGNTWKWSRSVVGWEYLKV